MIQDKFAGTKQAENSAYYGQDLLNSYLYFETVKRMREFFESRGFVEVHTQSRVSILAACEDPSTVQTYQFEGVKWPLPQTGQMWLEYELLTNPDAKGFYCLSTSFRNEPHPILGRHKTIFPMFEFETRGDINVLMDLERDLIAFLGIDKKENIEEKKYLDLAKHYGVKELETSHEEKMWDDFGNATLLSDFPEYTSPFWNMRRYDNSDLSRKVDAIICGQETIGSAERAVDPEDMRHRFNTISDGGYANLLFEHFGKERVMKELDEYLSLNFFERCGGGIGVTRMMRALTLLDIIKL